MGRERNSLVTWSVTALTLAIVHDLDHVRRHNYSTGPVRILGYLALSGAILAVALAATRHRYAPAFAFLVGFTGVVGLIAVHVLPHWSFFSDPFTADHVDSLSWAIVGADVASVAALGIAGAREAFRSRAHAPSAAWEAP
jgi:hypothetical protein